MPALWVVGVPLRPSASPVVAVAPGSSAWSATSGPGVTTKLLLAPACGGAEKSLHVNRTALPEVLNVMLPAQTPAASVTRSGLMVLAPVFPDRFTSPE